MVTRNYTRLLAGPKGKSKRGDVEFWFNTEIGWGTQGSRVLRVTNKDFTVLLAGQRYMLVALRCQFAKLDFLIIHAPHAWATNGRTLQQAVDEATAFWDDLFCQTQQGQEASANDLDGGRQHESGLIPVATDWRPRCISW